jgi:hypothetical protein
MSLNLMICQAMARRDNDEKRVISASAPCRLRDKPHGSRAFGLTRCGSRDGALTI